MKQYIHIGQMRNWYNTWRQWIWLVFYIVIILAFCISAYYIGILIITKPIIALIIFIAAIIYMYYSEKNDS